MDLAQLFTDHLAAYQAKRFAASWFCADRNERRARLRVVTQLSIELEAIRQKSIFATGLGEALIGDVIEGDWDSVATAAEDFRFKHESDELRAEYEPLWAKFVSIAEIAVVESRYRAGEPGQN